MNDAFNNIFEINQKRKNTLRGDVLGNNPTDEAELAYDVGAFLLGKGAGKVDKLSDFGKVPETILTLDGIIASGEMLKDINRHYYRY